jgi:hypothetical protein
MVQAVGPAALARVAGQQRPRAFVFSVGQGVPFGHDTSLYARRGYAYSTKLGIYQTEPSMATHQIRTKMPRRYIQ